MTFVLSPELALAYVRELSCDVAAAELRASDGTPLAGEPVRGAGGLVVRAAAGELVLGLGPCALPALVRHDGAAALAALSRPQETP
jgi:hypothetical protein